MYSRDELFLHSLKCYFGVYFPHCYATREINTKITLSWALKQFITWIHTLFSMYWDIPWIDVWMLTHVEPLVFKCIEGVEETHVQHGHQLTNSGNGQQAHQHTLQEETHIKHGHLQWDRAASSPAYPTRGDICKARPPVNLEWEWQQRDWAASSPTYPTRGDTYKTWTPTAGKGSKLTSIPYKRSNIWSTNSSWPTVGMGSKLTILQEEEETHVTSVSDEFHVCALWPVDTIWQQGYGSTLAQVMAWCRQAKSHYLNQCWLIISKILWHSFEGIIIRRSEDTSWQNKIENCTFKIMPRSPTGQWVKAESTLDQVTACYQIQHWFIANRILLNTFQPFFNIKAFLRSFMHLSGDNELSYLDEK